ncbi:hypothetical protein BDL97_16G092400 [Sphagnum fallax]|nr:hypothetical protein BDL97_16G092400 [Sphagnum fallax]
MPERKNSRDEFLNRLAELDLVGPREPRFSDYVNFQSDPLQDTCAHVQDIEMVQYQGMDKLSQNLHAHLPQILVEQSAPKSDGCFEHSLAHKPLPGSLKMQEGARWWVDLFGCCPPVGRMFSGIFSYNDNTANEVVATGGARVLEFDMLDPHGGATGGARVLGFDMLDPHGVTSTLVPLLNAEGRNV